MKIALGYDHAGFKHRDEIITFLKKKGHLVTDFGCTGETSCDYPPIAAKVAESVARGKADRGVLICGTGVGMSIAANKFKGVRAACCWADEIAPLISQHNMSNIICLPGRFATALQMIRWIERWIETPHSTEERHVRRIEQVRELEKKNCK